MESKNHFCKELIKWGYSVKDGTRVWDISSSKLWYLTPELAKGYLKLLEFEPFKKNVFDVEVELLKQNMGKIVEESGKKEFNMIDLDCSDGYRSEIVAKSIPSDVKARYCLVDSGSFFLDIAFNRLKKIKIKNLKINEPINVGMSQAGETIASLRNVEYPENIVLLLGSTLAAHDVNELLYNIGEGMLKLNQVKELYFQDIQHF